VRRGFGRIDFDHDSTADSVRSGPGSRLALFPL